MIPRALLPLACAAVIAGGAGLGRAAPPPFAGAEVSFVARDQPLKPYLEYLLGRAGLKAVISPAVTGRVNGEFQGSAEQVFQRVARGFDLLIYYDGAEVYVAPLSEAHTRHFELPPARARRIVESARELRLIDAQNRLQASGGLLVATGADRFLAQVAELADRPDPDARPRAAASPPPRSVAAEPERLEYRVYPLRYAWAEDVKLTYGSDTVTVPGVASILNSLIGRRRTLGTTSIEPRPAGLTGLGGTGLAAQAPSPATNSQLTQLLASARGQAGGPTTAAQPEYEPVSIQADPRLNAVIIRDYRSNLDGFADLIRELDVEPQVVQIEATIIDVDLQRAKQHGFSFSYQDSSGQNQVLISPDANALTTTPNQGLFVNAVVGNGNRFVARVNALESEGVIRVVSHPLVLTLSDTEAVFSNNQTFYVKVAGSLNVDLFNVTAGTTLKVTPHVLHEGGDTRIRLLVSIASGSLENQQVSAIPVVENSSVDTAALIREGQSLLVGGMTVQSSQKTKGKIPVLGDLPVVKGLFRSALVNDEHIERLFLITPRLTKVGELAPAPAGATGPFTQPDAKRGAS